MSGWTSPEVVVGAVVAVSAWAGSIGALVFKMGSVQEKVTSELRSLREKLSSIDSEIQIGRESRATIHGRIDEISTKVTVIETKQGAL